MLRLRLSPRLGTRTAKIVFTILIIIANGAIAYGIPLVPFLVSLPPLTSLIVQLGLYVFLNLLVVYLSFAESASRALYIALRFTRAVFVLLIVVVNAAASFLVPLIPTIVSLTTLQTQLIQGFLIAVLNGLTVYLSTKAVNAPEP